MKQLLTLLISLLMVTVSSLGAEQIFLRDNLSRANVGDFFVTGQNRAESLLLIADKTTQTILIHEISVTEGHFT